MAFIKKQIDEQTSFLYDRREIVVAPMWSTETSSLLTVFTSSNQPHHQRIYYRNVYATGLRTGSQDVDFTISYGNIVNSGSSTGSYGILTGSLSSSGAVIFNPVSESRAIYSSYRNMLIDTVNNKNNYLSSGKFKFYGLRDSNLGIYEWGFASESYAAVVPIDDQERIDIPDATSFQLKKALSVSCARNEDVSSFWARRRYYFVNAQGRLFQRGKNRITSIAPVTSNLLEMSSGQLWKAVAAGKEHVIAIRDDGTLWGWGQNDAGQLGQGLLYTVSAIETYFANVDTKTPVQIGNATNWEKVYAGADSSFAINSDGELYAWGYDSNCGSLGLGGKDIIYSSPTKIGTNTWNHISVGMTKVGALEEINTTVFGIDTSGRLWGWGDNAAYIGTRTKLSTANDYEVSPVLLSSDTDWVDVAAGQFFVIALKGNPTLIFGWGYSGLNGEWLAADQNDTANATNYTFANRKNLINLTTRPGLTNWYSGWLEVECGANFSCAISNDRKFWTWGTNDYEQLYFDTSPNTYTSSFGTSSNLSGWSNISSGVISSAGSINYPDTNVFSMTSDDIYVLNIERSNFKDKIDAGNWQLGLRTVIATGSTGQTIVLGSTATASNLITLVDESVNFDGTDYQHPMYDVTSKGGAVYGIYSGSIAKGIDKSAKNSPYGLFFPENGVMIFNGEMLFNTGSRSTIQIQTRRTPATSSGAFHLSSNADLFYASISGAMNVGLPFIANAVEVKHPTYIFARINNDEFNYTLNRTYYDEPGTYVVKDKLQTLGYPFTYITTIGLYNDADDLLAVAKLSKPIKKTPSTELVVKIKLDI